MNARRGRFRLFRRRPSWAGFVMAGCDAACWSSMGLPLLPTTVENFPVTWPAESRWSAIGIEGRRRYGLVIAATARPPVAIPAASAPPGTKGAAWKRGGARAVGRAGQPPGRAAGGGLPDHVRRRRRVALTAITGRDWER